MTQRTEIGRDLLRTEQQISTILEIAADAIVSLNERLEIVHFNKGAEETFGYTQSEVAGKPLDLLIPERFRRTHKTLAEEFSASPVPARRMGERQEIYGLHKDGSEFPAEASIAKRDFSGHKTYIVVLRDITERKKYETLLSRLNADLEARVAKRTRELEDEIQRREEAQAALIQAQRMEAFGQLTGGVAHDFNNLLTIMIGNLELLEKAVDGEPAQSYVTRITNAAQMGAALTARLLTFARRRRLLAETLDLNDLLLNVTELLKRALGETITLSTMLAGNLWLTRADASEVENAILNLAINARDAMPNGGTLFIETQNIVISDTQQENLDQAHAGDYVLVAVSDTGLGMSSDVLEHAFEPFFTTKEPGKGTGLGLSTLYGFAAQSGGFASISSEIGKGTTVSLYLPRTEEDPKPRPAEEPAAIPYSENNEVILVVEDNAEVREVTLQRVEGLGYVVIEAEDGAAAIRILESGEQIDAVLSDIVMPGSISGYDLARWIHKHTPQVKIILTTGYAADEPPAENGYTLNPPILTKPYDRAELAFALNKILHTP
jgi:PAS domain S-box-containing protein